MIAPFERGGDEGKPGAQFQQEIGDGFSFTLPEAVFNLMGQNGAAPAVDSGILRIKQGLANRAAFYNNGHVMAQGNLEELL